MSPPERVQGVALFDHRDAPALPRLLSDLLKTDGPKQVGRRGQHTETPEEDVFIPTVMAELDRRVEESSAQPQRPGGRLDQEPTQLTIPPGTANDGDAADEAPVSFSYPEHIAVGSLVDELPQETGDVRLESRVEATFPRVDGPMQGDEGAQIAWPQIIPQRESRVRIRGKIFE
jgi:hypothetical protein